MDTVLIPLMRSPKLPQYIDELQKALAEEAAARKQFRDWVTPGMKAEFINGEVSVHPPAKYHHNEARALTERLLGLYVDKHNLGKVQGEKAMIEMARNDYEPDICYWRNKKSFAFEPEQMVFPPPDLIVEVLSPSTQKTDRGAKFDDYALNGVPEYWIVDPVERVVEQFLLRHGSFVLHAKLSGTDTIESVVIDGFTAPAIALFDTSANLDAVAVLLR